MKNEVVHQSNITLEVGLDVNKVPEQLFWSAPDGGVERSETKAFLLSVWDHQSKESLRKINPWVAIGSVLAVLVLLVQIPSLKNRIVNTGEDLNAPF